MPPSILVAYASRYGSTEEVARTVAATVGEGGYPVDLRSMQLVSSLDGYHAVVMGAPIYIGRWHKDAHAFLEQHKDALMERPVAIFALGPIQYGEQAMQGSRAQLSAELQAYPWLDPVTVTMFGGKYDPARLGFPHSLLVDLPASPLRQMPPSDLRDWAAIRTWAGSLVAAFQGAADDSD